jgi:hypothetical protein
MNSIFKQLHSNVIDTRATQKETLQTCLPILHNREAAKLQLHVANFIFYELLERKQKKLLKTFFPRVGMSWFVVIA